MSVSCTYQFGMSVTETLTSGVEGSANPVLEFSAYNRSATLNASSTPPITKHVQTLLTLSTGALTINLAALTGINGLTVDGTGLRVQMIRVKNLGANAMTFAGGASNGIDLACGTFVVPSGGITQMFFNDASPDIASGDRTIDVTGTGAQTFEFSILMG